VNESFNTLILLFVFILFGLFFDSKTFSDFYDHGQVIANILLLITFFIFYFKGTTRVKELMVYAILIGILGECLFSLVFKMYTYRFENIPIYIPPGHAIIYIVTFYFCRKPTVKLTKPKLEIIFPILIFLYSFAFLIFANDIFGFILTLLTLLILHYKPRERLFYYVMYLVVVVLELIGTNYQCWKWPSEAFDTFSLLKSANPPSGISFFYFGLDLGSLWLYKQRHKIAWNRMKIIRNINR
jgi:hypothetical protein